MLCRDRGRIVYSFILLTILYMITQNTKIWLKPLILSGAGVLLLIGLTVLANDTNRIRVKTDLDYAVQTIREVVFSPTGLREDPAAEVRMYVKDGIAHIDGKVIAASTATNTMTPWAANSAIIESTNSTLEGTNSAILGGKNGEILGIQTQSAVLMGGERNIIDSWSKNVVIGGGRGNRLQGANSIILAGQNATARGANNAILWGVDVTVSGSMNFVAGANINYTQRRDNTFVWSDNKTRLWGEKLLIPQVSNAFYVRSDGGMGIGTANPITGGVQVEGMVQIADQNVRCEAKTNGVIRFHTPSGRPTGCFCGCDGKRRSSLVSSTSCESICGSLN